MAHPEIIDVWSIAPKPGEAEVMMVGVRGYKEPGIGGVYRTLDGGAHWQRVDKDIVIDYEDPPPDNKRWARSIDYSPDGSSVYAGFSSMGWDFNKHKGLFYSRDDGSTWKKVYGIPNNDIQMVHADPSMTNRLWVGSDGGGSHRIDIMSP
jgi:photosystem II stability/assembly factor-like uncharacterized protein